MDVTNQVLGLYTPARRVNVVSAGVVGVDRTVEGVIRRTVERVLVKAGLLYHSVRIVHVGAAAEEELDVALERVQGRLPLPRVCSVKRFWLSTQLD